MQLKKPKRGWYPEVWLNLGQYYGFAVHTNGKVEAACIRTKLVDAVLSTDELCNMMNLYHRGAGAYAGDAVRVGTQVSADEIGGILHRTYEAFIPW